MQKNLVLVLGIFLLFLVSPLASGEALIDHLGLTLLTADLTNPVSIANAGDGSNRLFIVEQEGVIRIYDFATGTLLEPPFLDIRDDVFSFEDAGGHTEQGLLGLAFHQDYSNNGKFYVNYTISPAQNEWHTVVAEFLVSGNPDVAQASGNVILQFDQENRNHNGGDLHFGLDGYLYIASGDGGGGNDQYDNAQNINTLKGAILRIDVDGTPPEGGELCGAVQDYGIPPDNPFTGTGDGCDEILHFGLRNPWRFSFDAMTSDIYIADVGQNTWEEINFMPFGFSEVNFGWSCREGLHDFPAGKLCTSAYTDPVLEYSHADSNCSVTGGYVYRGSTLSINGYYVYGDYCSGRIWLARKQGGNWSSEEWTNGNPMEFGLSAFGQDQNCELYMVNRSSHKLYRFTDSEFVFRGGFESLACR